MDENRIRINLYLAKCGICSRREADRYIADGRVSVNGVTAVAGTKITLMDHVEVDHRMIRMEEKKVVLAYNKPIGITCTMKDEHAEQSLADVINYPVRLTYAGRLDRDSEGLLLLTNDGKLIDAMMRAANCHEKEYIVTVREQITLSFIEQMSQGVWLEELNVRTRPCTVKKLGSNTFSIILTQGYNRQIRRMAATLQYHVTGIRRIRVMGIQLGDLASGHYRELSETEKNKLYREAGLDITFD